MHPAFTRRDFLRWTTAAAGGLAIAPVLSRGLARGASASDAQVSVASFDEGLDAFILAKMNAARLPSLAAAAVDGQRLEWSKAYGTADIEAGLDATTDTAYLLASISKTVVCAAFMHLWEAGSVDLDADVNRYLPFKVRNPNHPRARITPRMLLTHTSGILDRWIWGAPGEEVPYGFTVGDSSVSLRDVLAAYLVPGGDLYVAEENFASYAPGEGYDYCSLAVDLVALAVEEVSRRPFDAFCAEHLFAPLGMTNTAYHLADLATTDLAMPYDASRGGLYVPWGHYGMADYPCAMLRSSAASLSRWLRCFMNRGALEGVTILRPATVDEILRRQLIDPWGGDQGLIWYTVWMGGETLLGHGGNNFGVNTSMYFAPDRGVGAVLLGNQQLWWPPSAPSRFQEIQDALFDLA